jgi:hypothetical protein
VNKTKQQNRIFPIVILHNGYKFKKGTKNNQFHLEVFLNLFHSRMAQMDNKIIINNIKIKNP